MPCASELPASEPLRSPNKSLRQRNKEERSSCASPERCLRRNRSSRRYARKAPAALLGPLAADTQPDTGASAAPTHAIPSTASRKSPAANAVLRGRAASLGPAAIQQTRTTVKQFHT